MGNVGFITYQLFKTIKSKIYAEEPHWPPKYFIHNFHLQLGNVILLTNKETEDS